MKIDSHHITRNPEFCVEVPAKFHMFIADVERWKASAEKYMLISNCQAALNYQALRILKQLSELDDKNENP